MTQHDIRDEAALTISGEGRRWSLAAGAQVVIGRSADADIRIDDPEVSRRHAQLVATGPGGWVVSDLGSVNGTYVDGRRVTSADVGDGSVIALGPDPRAPRLTLTGAGSGAGASGGGDADSAAGAVESGAGQAPLSWPDSGGGGARGPDAPPRVVPTDIHGCVTIGRAADNTLTIDDLQASRYHARATRRGDGFWIEDLGSLNGTYLNGRPISAALCGANDLLTIGRRQFRAVGGELIMTRQHREVSLVARDLRVVLPDGKQLLGGVDFALPTASLMAVIGPSGAGKSTLLGALTGARKASSGQVGFDGRDLYANYHELRQRIGLVPQDDVVHPQLSVRQALEYASRLRFPADLDVRARRARIGQVVAELELSAHIDTRIDRLSGGQRKRTSVALELLTEPSLLFLDEPTSGLDPGLDKSVMTTLRTLADGGRTVVVVTHNVANLGLCDRVLLLAPGGTVAYFGPPENLLGYFGLGDYSDVFTQVSARPDAATDRFRRYGGGVAGEELHPPRPGPPAAPLRQQPIHTQVATLAARHLRVLAADRSYAAFTAALPLVLALLVLAVPGSAGFGPPGTDRPTEKLQLLVVLIVGAAFMGLASSARDLVAERPIYARERGVGLSASAYLTAKLGVYLGLALVQSAVLLGVVMVFTEAPAGDVALGHPVAELYVAVAATTFASACLGLLISATVSTSEQVMPLLVVAIMAQLVLCGGLIPVADQAVLEQLSWLAPSRWGYAAGASTVEALGVPRVVRDELWEHTASAWWKAIGMLGAFMLLTTIATGLRLRRVGARR